MSFVQPVAVLAATRTPAWLRMVPTWVTPDHLTLSRVWLLLIMAISTSFGAFLLPVLFLVGCVTDYLDGEVARLRGQCTPEGKQLDALADKLFVFGTLLIAALAGVISFWSWVAVGVLVLLLRDLLVTCLRLCNPARAEAVPSLPLAKWKTAVFMVAIGCLLLGALLPPIAGWSRTLGECLVAVAVVLSLWSGVQYWRLYMMQ